uniref:Uncharacterized protein n=1 Tax=Arundo donax TaxID=35708 RepID=A0A0A9GYL8_ARUDO
MYLSCKCQNKNAAEVLQSVDCAPYLSMVSLKFQYPRLPNRSCIYCAVPGT